MAKIVKSYSKKTPDEIQGGGVKVFLSWEKLKGYLEVAGSVKLETEQLDGIIANLDGITIKISSKKENE